MNRQKDIFDFFRDNQHRLNEPPSPQAWRRLERRLDAHQRRGRVALYRTLGMVAGVLILVAIITLISTLMHEKQREILSGMPQGLEYLKPSDGDATAYQVVEFSRTYQDRMARPIEEGAPDKKLVPVER